MKRLLIGSDPVQKDGKIIHDLQKRKVKKMSQMRNSNQHDEITREVPFLRDLLPVLKGNPKIIFAYIFGSYAKGKAKERSDLDIAVWVKEPVDKLELITALGEAVRKEVDVVILNTAPPLLRHQVMRYGKLLFCKDRKELVRFKVWTMKEYEDFRWLQETYTRRRYGR